MPILDDDLEFYSDPRDRRGGQHVGVSSGVLVVHRPTGLAVVSRDERSQLANKTKALLKLENMVALITCACEVVELHKDVRHNVARNNAIAAMELLLGDLQ